MSDFRRGLAVVPAAAGCHSHFIVCALLAIAAAWTSAAANELDDVMDQDPALVPPAPVKVFDERLKPLWLSALSRPEADLQRLAAESFTRAHQLGMQGLDQVVQPLEQRLRTSSTQEIARLACARALVTLDAKQSAEALFQYLEIGGLDASQLIEPALAEWDYAPMRKVWLGRLAEANPSRQRLRLAINGLGKVGETTATARLLELAASRDGAPAVRLSAARALASLGAKDLPAVATRLAQDSSRRGMIDRLVAVSMLDQPTTDLELLGRFAQDAEPAVAGVALGRLLVEDPNRVVRLADTLTSSRDATVRRLTAEALAKVPSAANVALLAPLLDDHDPQNRKFVRQSLIRLAKDQSLREEVISEASRQLATQNWRGLEQATIVLATLGHEPSASRFAELLDFSRPEVYVAAAWGLRKLAVPSTLPAMLKRAERMADKKYGPQPDMLAIDLQVAHLFQALGQMDVTSAEPLLRRYIPKNSHPLKSRVAAIWSLGHFHAGKADPELTKEFVQRIIDLDHPAEPELADVCRMAAISLGRMKAKDSLDQLRGFLAGTAVNTELGYAYAWAIQQITGEPIPPLETPIQYHLGWFLEPEGEAR